MEPKGVILEGKTLDDAVKKGLEALGLSRAEVMITVIEEGSGGFLGLGARPYKVRVMPRPRHELQERPARREREGARERGRDSGRERGRRGGRAEGGRAEGGRRDGRSEGRGPRRAEGRGRPGEAGARDDRPPRRREGRGPDRGREERPGEERLEPGRETRAREERGPERPREERGRDDGGRRRRRGRTMGAAPRDPGGAARDPEGPAREPMEPMEPMERRERAPRPPRPHRDHAPAALAEEAGPTMSAEDLEKTSRELTGSLLQAMGFEATVSARVDGTSVEVKADVPTDGDLLVGHKGEVRQALQHLLTRMLNRGASRYHLQLEVNDFWERRERELEEMARTLADEVAADGEERLTEYLNAQERRIVHVTLREDTRVRTHAIGDGLIKKVAIAPAGGAEESKAGE